jgi:hypothetical protein
MRTTQEPLADSDFGAMHDPQTHATTEPGELAPEREQRGPYGSQLMLVLCFALVVFVLGAALGYW